MILTGDCLFFSHLVHVLKIFLYVCSVWCAAELRFKCTECKKFCPVVRMGALKNQLLQAIFLFKADT